jgi:hypothetical protein
MSIFLRKKINTKNLNLIIKYFREKFLIEGLRNCWGDKHSEAEHYLKMDLLLGHPKAKEILKEIEEIKLSNNL